MFLRTLTRFTGVALVALTLSACDEEDVANLLLDDDVTEVISADPDLTTLATALTEAGLITPLQAAGPFTVFAPRNAAFAALDADVLAGLLEDGNVDLLSRVLTLHVIPGARLEAADLSDGDMATSLEGGTLTIGVSGSTVSVNGATVVEADIEAENGVIHIIDEVLVPSDNNVYETAVLTPATTTLASAVLAAGLDDDLSGTGPFTVFAPTNDAFAALGTLPTGQDLIDVLTYHVLDTEVASSALSDGLVVTNTLNGASFTVNITGSDVTITDQAGNTVNVILTDVAATNGVIHVIDGVIIPTP